MRHADDARKSQKTHIVNIATPIDSLNWRCLEELYPLQSTQPICLLIQNQSATPTEVHEELSGRLTCWCLSSHDPVHHHFSFNPPQA